MGSLFKKKKLWVITCELEGGPGADESGVQVTVEGNDYEEAMAAGREAAKKVVHCLVGTPVTGCRVVSCRPK